MTESPIGTWLRDHRRERQQDVAANVGRSQSWLSQIEAGRARPSAQDVVRLAVAMDADPVEALDVWGYTPPWARQLRDMLTRVLVELKVPTEQ